MPKISVICFIASFLFYGLGYSKSMMFNTGHIYTYNDTLYLYLATIYYVLTIFFAVIGSLAFYIKAIAVRGKLKGKQSYEYQCLKEKAAVNRARSRVNIPSVEYSYRGDMERRMTS
ncbi:hypothetical protein Desaci_2939 [Desulfosporosinus acidiphilus SJ4]|uniref:Uncharacterized protein n=1 Tax=Desulfosporosinus acidiphilus (strain DSM 22704 / JCM 16185 / SJ4) TaxID=646529 RepID=I4D7S6_DESAJ|nr:hypothetical protein [Desulfosporosinus acidiphilus]AFM41850.1 hypothetical protein Desaci_2939 [Desulfosporosinus acidiphilus SJ4]